MLSTEHAIPDDRLNLWPNETSGFAVDLASVVGATPAKTRRQLLSSQEMREVQAGFRELLVVTEDTEPHLRGVINDTLAHPGGLLRAQLIYGLLRHHGAASDTALALAIAIEYLHTASLLFDDLPAMDDASERRGQPCPHLVHGEAATILGALALITRAYDLLWKVIGPLPDRRRQQSADLVAECLGPPGVLNGQAHDLHFSGNAELAHRVAQGKTVSLVRLTLVLPALVLGLDSTTTARLERLSMVWGLSYQALDDLKDRLVSDDEAGKSTGRDRLLGRPNLADVIGVRETTNHIERLLAEGRQTLNELARDNSTNSGRGSRHPHPWATLTRLQALLDDEKQDMGRRATAARGV